MISTYPTVPPGRPNIFAVRNTFAAAKWCEIKQERYHDDDEEDEDEDDDDDDEDDSLLLLLLLLHPLLLEGRRCPTALRRSDSLSPALSKI